MNLTPTQLELLFGAWALHARDCGVVVAEDAESEADELVEHGWLQRATVANGDACYAWTMQAEAALELHALTEA